MSLQYPWLRWHPDANICDDCHTSAAHAAAYLVAEAEYREACDVRLGTGKPSPEVRGRRADLQLAVTRRQECRRGHGEENDDAEG